MYNSGKTQIDYSDDHGGNKNFHIIKRLTSGQKYYFAAGCIGSNTGSYTFRIVFRSSPVSNAYSTIWGLANRIVTIQLVGSTTTNSIWKQLIEASKNAWNSTKAGTNISLTTEKSNHTLEVIAYEWPTFGQTWINPSGNVVATSSVIQINTNTTVRIGTERLFAHF